MTKKDTLGDLLFGPGRIESVGESYKWATSEPRVNHKRASAILHRTLERPAVYSQESRACQVHICLAYRQWVFEQLLRMPQKWCCDFFKVDASEERFRKEDNDHSLAVPLSSATAVLVFVHSVSLQSGITQREWLLIRVILCRCTRKRLWLRLIALSALVGCIGSLKEMRWIVCLSLSLQPAAILRLIFSLFNRSKSIQVNELRATIEPRT